MPWNVNVALYITRIGAREPTEEILTYTSSAAVKPARISRNNARVVNVATILRIRSSSFLKTLFFDKLLAVQGRTAIFDGCKLLKMGVFRKPRFLKDDVKKAMEGFFNSLLVA
jgi:hypothetical protein